MPQSQILVYPEYAGRREYVGVPMTFGGFGIMPKWVDRRWKILIKQRQENGSFPLSWDLPGGGRHVGPEGDAVDQDLEACCLREVEEEVRCRRRYTKILAKIGSPLYLPVFNDEVLIKVDCAQAFLVHTTDTPQVSDEAIDLAWIDQFTFADYPVVSRKATPDSPAFGRTPAMIFLGLSVLQQPFWRGNLTTLPLRIRRAIIGDTNSSDYVLVEGGRYLGRAYWGVVWGRKVRQIALYYRLDPHQPDGRFYGELEQILRH